MVRKTRQTGRTEQARLARLANMPQVRIGLVGVSRNSFPAELTKRRLRAVSAELRKAGLHTAQACRTTVISEADVPAALAELQDKGCSALVLYLGNFGPEGPTSMLAQRFPGPVMACAAAEENCEVLAAERGDALCGLLNLSYNLGLRRVRAYIPPRPVGQPAELVAPIAEFESIARVVLGLSSLKVMAFGPRPAGFYACNAPIQPLAALGIEVMENSELDLAQLYRDVGQQTRRIARVASSMKRELGPGVRYGDLLPTLAQFEVALMDFMEANLGACAHAVFANKCWPAFEREFGFVPCYVNSRLAGRGIPVACEVDVYGAVSEYVAQLASQSPATLLDINNSVPAEVLPSGTDLMGAKPEDLFMGFHCGNTPSQCMKDCSMGYQLIMNRVMEGEGEPDITRGTLEGQIRPGPVTMLRLQATPDCRLLGYAAEGHVLDVAPRTFGSTGIVAIANFARFYRHVLVGRQFPHHTAVGFAHVGRIAWEAMRLLGVEDLNAPLPASMRYDSENPFA